MSEDSHQLPKLFGGYKERIVRPHQSLDLP